MNQPGYPVIEKTGFSTPAIIVLTLSLILLQEGLNYYASFQILALVTIATLIFLTAHSMRGKIHFIFGFLIFAFSLAITGFILPAAISRNSSNIFITVIGVLGYAAMIGCLPHFKFKRAGLILNVLRSVSSATILILAGSMALSESGLVSFLTRDALLQKNTRLIDNYLSADALFSHQTTNMLLNMAPRINLFYGEPSFLAIVLFTCLGSFMLTSKLLTNASNGSEYIRLKSIFKLQESIILIGTTCLLYVESFSSIIYAIIIIYFAFIKEGIARAKPWKSISFLIIIIIVFLTVSYEYFLHRVTQQQDLSLIQRFGFLLDFSLSDFLIGIKEESKLPEEGIHNGLFYIIATSGVGGILYIASLFRSIFNLSSPMKSSIFSVLLVLAIMMQNGAVFSPSKVVLFSLILLPLACVRSIYLSREKPYPH